MRVSAASKTQSNYPIIASNWVMLFASIGTRPYFIAVLLFAAALVPRLPGLGRFLTSDENTNIFFAGSDVIAALLQGNFRGTYWHFYPGVTMSWLDAFGMGGQYLWDWLARKALPPFHEYIYRDILSLLIATRLPYVVLTAAAVPATYLLARQLLPNRVALLGALFLAFDPFYLAHSRVVHGDAPVSVFMSLSALTFFIYMGRLRRVGAEPARRDSPAEASTPVIPARRYLVASAVLGGLAALTKAPGQFMALFTLLLSLLYIASELWHLKQQQSLRITHYALRLIPPCLNTIIIWGLISLTVFVLLWPAMWVDPFGTFQRMWRETFDKVNTGHLVYFWGAPTLDPGAWFYLYVIPFRLTPVVLIGLGLSLLLFIPQVNALFFGQQGLSQPRRSHLFLSPHFLLWFFIITLLLFGNLSPKKQDRYLLPLFPFLDLLAALGWTMINDQFRANGPLWVIIKNKLFHLQSSNYALRITHYALRITNFLFLILLILQFTPTLTYYPYYLAYFNPLMGGPVQAAKTTLMGWGEGMEQVAAYLNSKAGAKSLYVASTPSQTLLPYFAGTGENFYTNDIAFRADYVVLYLAQMQRLAPSPEIVAYFDSRQPEKTIAIHGVTYAKIYPGPKLILSDIPADAIPINVGLDHLLRLAGYHIEPPQPGEQTVKLSLYWHTLAPLMANYTISVRARSEDNRLLVQQDQWPVNGLLPTSQWRQGDYVTDIHMLELPTTAEANIDHFELVVYNAETGATLGPPITIKSQWPPGGHSQ